MLLEVKGAAVGPGGLFVDHVLALLGLVDRDVGPAHLQVPLTADTQHGVPQRFRVEPPQGVTPKPTIIGVELEGLFPQPAGLAVGR